MERVGRKVIEVDLDPGADGPAVAAEDRRRDRARKAHVPDGLGVRLPRPPMSLMFRRPSRAPRDIDGSILFFSRRRGEATSPSKVSLSPSRTRPQRFPRRARRRPSRRGRSSCSSTRGPSRGARSPSRLSRRPRATSASEASASRAPAPRRAPRRPTRARPRAGTGASAGPRHSRRAAAGARAPAHSHRPCLPSRDVLVRLRGRGRAGGGRGVAGARTGTTEGVDAA